MPRRGVNIYKRKDGRWEGRIKQEDSANGTRKYRSVYGQTYAEVKKRMEAIRAEKASAHASEKYTLGQAAEIWMRERSMYWKKTTCATYQNMVCKYLLPRLGNVPLGDMDEARMEKFLSEIRQEKNLSDSYLRNLCAVIIRVMKYMQRRHHCEIAVPDHILPSGRRSERELPGEGELAVLEKYLLQKAEAGDHTCLGILTALYMGLRIGETCALTWEDVDLREGILHVRKNMQRVRTDRGTEGHTAVVSQTPKTNTSLRMIPIPPVLLPFFEKQKEEGSHYIIKGKKKPWAEPRTLQYRFAKILSRCGLGSFNFHMLRHAFATRCIARGFDIKSLSEILGHSSIQITLNLYVHSSMQRKKQLMEQLSVCFYQDYSAAV